MCDQEEQKSTCCSELIERIRSQKESLDNGSLDVDLSIELTALLTSAVHDKSPQYTISDILRTINSCDVSSYLDSLNVIPLLLDCNTLEAGEVLSLLSKQGSAKESIIAIQESLERLTLEVSNEYSEEINLFLQLERLLQICKGSIPRLKLRKRSASESLRPLLIDISQAIEQAAPYANPSQSATMMHLIRDVLYCALSWAQNQDNPPDIPVFKGICKDVIISTLGDFAEKLETNLAQYKFETCFPRLFPRKTSTKCEFLIQNCTDLALKLDISPKSLLDEKSTGSLVLFSFMLLQTEYDFPSPNRIYLSLYPLISASLQSLIGIDASLHILLHVFFVPSSPNGWDPDILSPVASSLASLSCISSDPQIRFVSFRVLGRILYSMPPLEHMSLLRDLLSEDSFPAMRVAAIGLLKDAVLEALSNKSDSPFASPDLFRTFGYIVLRSDPPDLFSNSDDRNSLDSFLKTQEPKRLVECLAFYYVVLMRDTDNLTKIRDNNQIKSVEKEFLSPIRKSLKSWSELQDVSSEHTMMALAALRANIERIDEAVVKVSV